MKAVVLAAGRGTRLQSLVSAVPKPMLAVGGRPVIDRNLSLLAESGAREVFMNLHHCPEVVRAYCGSGARWGLKITYAFEPQLLGTAGAVRNFASYLGEGPFFVVYADNYFDCKFSTLWNAHGERSGVATIALFERDDVTGCGVVQLDADDRVVRFIEKPLPSEAPSHLINGGLYVVSPTILPLIPDTMPCDFGYDVFPALLQAGHLVYGRVMAGALSAIDTPELYEELRARIGHGSA